MFPATNRFVFPVLLISSWKSVSVARKCDEWIYYAGGPLESCSCQDGYEAVVEQEYDVGFPFLFTAVLYKCCESGDEERNKESYQCGSSLLPNTNVVPDGFEECTWDECSSTDDSSSNVFSYGHDHNASKCVALPGKECDCSSGYIAKKTGQSVPIHNFFETGQVMYAHQFICCPVPVTRFGTSFRPEDYDGPTCTVPECDDECLSSDVCFEELGCYTPEHVEEYKGCVSNKCANNSPFGYATFGLGCWADPNTREHGCHCEDGMVAKITGRTSFYTGAVEYVCCPPGTPGADESQCNGNTIVMGWWFLLCVLLFPLLFAIWKKVRSIKGKNQKNIFSKENNDMDTININDSCPASIAKSLSLMEKDLIFLQEQITTKLRQQEKLMKMFKAKMETVDDISEYDSKDVFDDEYVEEKKLRASSNNNNSRTSEHQQSRSITSLKSFRGLSKRLTRDLNFVDNSIGSNSGGKEFEGIHQYVLHYITDFQWDKQSHFHILGRCFSVFAAPLLSWIFLLLPLYILLMIMFESQHPKCIFGGCERHGEVCSGPPDDDDSYCEGVGEACSYLKHTTKPTPWSTIVTCAFAFLYVLSGTLRDMAQNHRATQAAVNRFKTKKGNNTLINSWIRFNLWAINIVRGYLIPGVTFASSIAILHSAEDSLKVSNILLNGVAIIIIGDLDDLMGQFFISSETQEKVSNEMEAALAAAAREATGNDKHAEDYHTYSELTDRVMSLIMYVASVQIATCPLDAMLHLLGDTSCDTFLYVQFVPVAIGLGFAAIDSSSHGPSPSWAVIFVEYMTNTIFIAILVIVGYLLSSRRTFG